MLDGSDSLDGKPGDDPLDRGVAPPERWSAGIRYGTTQEEQEEGESLDQLLAEEEPDTLTGLGDEDLDDDETAEAGREADGEDVAEEDVDGLLLDDGPDPRAGQLVAEDQDYDGAYPDSDPDLVG